MTLMAIDPGALYLGWAILEPGPSCTASGISGVERGKQEKYQDYRLRLIEFWADYAPRLLDEHKPDLVVSETVPVTGFNVATQSVLASTAVTVIEAIALNRSIEVKHVAAQTAKKAVGGSGKATKTRVRKGVYQLLPQLKARDINWPEDQWTAGHWDETDAIACGLTYLGYKNG